MTGKFRSTDGYTITEVLVVLIIVGLLAGLALPVALTSVTKAREATLRTNLSTIRGVIDDYYSDTLSYPADLNALVEQGYLRTLPQDTIEKNDREWRLIYADDSSGIIDIKSNSTEEALDGTRYANW